jgi:hypothetical protein
MSRCQYLAAKKSASKLLPRSFANKLCELAAANAAANEFTTNKLFKAAAANDFCQ